MARKVRTLQDYEDSVNTYLRILTMAKELSAEYPGLEKGRALVEAARQLHASLQLVAADARYLETDKVLSAAADAQKGGA